MPCLANADLDPHVILVKGGGFLLTVSVLKMTVLRENGFLALKRNNHWWPRETQRVPFDAGSTPPPTDTHTSHATIFSGVVDGE